MFYLQGGHQEDAEEFLGFFLDALEDELLSITQSSMPKAEESSEAAPTQDEGWLEVGKKNRQVVTRTVRLGAYAFPSVTTTDTVLL